MLGDGDEADKRRRFREAALPHLDALYTVALYHAQCGDAEDAVQECYLRAFRYFDGVRGKDIKPWLMAILRNVCSRKLPKRVQAA
jgi:RNA polymerase sigma-70 factor (ECF subfamily)